MIVWIKQHDESCNYSCTSFCFSHILEKQVFKDDMMMKAVCMLSICYIEIYKYIEIMI